MSRLAQKISIYGILGLLILTSACNSPTKLIKPIEKGGFSLKKSTYAPLGKGIIPIGAWISPPRENIHEKNPNYITNENFKNVKDAGLNFIISLYENLDISVDSVLKALDAADANGLKLIVNDPGIASGQDDYDTMVERIKTYSGSPAYLGTMLYDEPAIPLFDSFALVRDSYKKACPDNVFYINILPDYAKKDQCYVNKAFESGGNMTKEDYKNYLTQYVSKINPEFISYDYYPCEGAFPSIKEGYFTNMCEVREIAGLNGIPFWVFIQSCSFGSYVRVPKRAETFWQVNTALALGALGIQYFCYWMPLEYDSWEGGIVSRTGEKTPIYNDVKDINKQISAIDAVLTDCVSKGVITLNSSPAPIPEKVILSSYGEFSSVTGTNNPILIGCFDQNGKDVFYVVNNSIETDCTFNINFKANKHFRIIQNAINETKTSKSLKLSLKAGEGVLIQID